MRSALGGLLKPQVAVQEGFKSNSGLGDLVTREFNDALHRSEDTAVAVAAIKALTTVIRHSSSTTVMGLSQELHDAARELQKVLPSSIALKAGCDLFLRYTITRTRELESPDIERVKARLIERGIQFADTSTRARQTIAQLGTRFISPGSRVLTHGYSRVVLALLSHAASQGINFHVVVTEGRPDSIGAKMARALVAVGIGVTVVLDAGVAAALEGVDMVLLGAEAVVESGGIVNKLGTYQMALGASALHKPFYVAAESYKFARLYPLSQKDIPAEKAASDMGPLLPTSVHVDIPSRDYTPPHLITLLVTDLGVLTPAAVSDELIMMYS